MGRGLRPSAHSRGRYDQVCLQPGSPVHPDPACGIDDCFSNCPRHSGGSGRGDPGGFGEPGGPGESSAPTRSGPVADAAIHPVYHRRLPGQSGRFPRERDLRDAGSPECSSLYDRPDPCGDPHRHRFWRSPRHPDGPLPELLPRFHRPHPFPDRAFVPGILFGHPSHSWFLPFSWDGFPSSAAATCSIRSSDCTILYCPHAISD